MFKVKKIYPHCRNCVHCIFHNRTKTLPMDRKGRGCHYEVCGYYSCDNKQKDCEVPEFGECSSFEYKDSIKTIQRLKEILKNIGIRGKNV